MADYFDPPLSTIRIPSYGLGWASGERLVRLVQGEPRAGWYAARDPSWLSVIPVVKKRLDSQSFFFIRFINRVILEFFNKSAYVPMEINQLFSSERMAV